MLYFFAELSQGLPSEPRVLGSSELLFEILSRILDWGRPHSLGHPECRLLAVLQDEIRRPEEQVLRLPLPRQAKMARVARAVLQNVADGRTLDEWAKDAGMARRTFMRAFSREMCMPFGRWRQHARLFASLELLARGMSITDVAIAVGYGSVSAFNELFRAALGTAPKAYFGAKTIAPLSSRAAFTDVLCFGRNARHPESVPRLRIPQGHPPDGRRSTRKLINVFCLSGRPIRYTTIFSV
jgi:AraC-like DNA-binding protein